MTTFQNDKVGYIAAKAKEAAGKEKVHSGAFYL